MSSQDKGKRNLELDIVLVTLNRLDLLKALYGQIKEMILSRYDFVTLTIVDNGSTDGTVEWLKRLQIPEVFFYEENQGYAVAGNKGAALGIGEFILFLDDDVQLIEGFLEPLIEAFDDSDVALAGPRLKKPDGSYHAFTFLGGCCVMARRDWFDGVGGWDERFVFGKADYDLTMRAREMGLQALEVQASEVIHTIGPLTEEMAEFKKDNWEAGEPLLEEKWNKPFLRWVGGSLTGYPTRDLTWLEAYELDRTSLDFDLETAKGLKMYEVIEAEEEEEVDEPNNG